MTSNFSTFAHSLWTLHTSQLGSTPLHFDPSAAMAVAFALAPSGAAGAGAVPSPRLRGAAASNEGGFGAAAGARHVLLGFAAMAAARVAKVALGARRREVLRLGGAGAASALMPQVALAKTKQEMYVG